MSNKYEYGSMPVLETSKDPYSAQQVRSPDPVRELRDSPPVRRRQRLSAPASARVTVPRHADTIPHDVSSVAPALPEPPPVRRRQRPSAPVSGPQAAAPVGLNNVPHGVPNAAPPEPSIPGRISGGESPPKAEYEIGYHRPPKHTRFKPGQSGNPKGRPKGRKNTNTLLRDALNTKIRIKALNGRTKVATIHEALIDLIVADALKDKGRPRDRLIQMLPSVEADADDREKPNGGAAEPQDAEDEAYVAEFRRMLLRAHQQGSKSRLSGKGDNEEPDS